jgi:ribosomal protein S14
MKSLINKNLSFRKSFNILEKRKRVFRYLLLNNKIFLHIRWQCFLNIVRINSTSGITKSKNFCFITGKTKIFSKKYRMSRFALRKLILNGRIPNFF